MFHGLDTTLRDILDDSSVSADVSFNRPSDADTPDKATIDLFLYDVRENTELRSSEPVVERQNGVATIRRPPVRVACSYLVTVWSAADLIGEDAILKEHELLGEVMRVFAGIPEIPLDSLTGVLAAQPYPIPLSILQGDLTRNPAEFWSALGGKLRPSFTLTATIALMPSNAPVSAHLVSSSKLVVATKRPDVPEKDGKLEEITLQVGGRVTKAESGEAVSGVIVTLPALGRQVETDNEGKFVFSGMPAGNYTLQFSKPGFVSDDLQVQVPGGMPTAFDVKLTAESH
jgi:hypothetical protein